MKENYCVYIHIFPNGKVYVGVTCNNPLYRWNGGKGYRRQPRIYNAILKYGWDNIKHEILYTNLTKDEAETKEVEVINKYKSDDKKHGYNVDGGGIKTRKMGKEHIKNISVSMKKTANTKEFKEEISKRFKGNKYSLGVQRNKKYTDRISIKVICVETGEIFNSVIEASRRKNINRSNLHYAVCGKRKTAGGCHWKRVD